MATSEGYHHDVQTGVTEGLPCAGAIVPAIYEPSGISIYDVIVIGAGFAGLCCARDLAIKGHKVLLLEARDRIGGRTYTTVLEGYPYEMGGTWVHWGQPHVWSELSRYDLVDELEDSFHRTSGLMNHTFKFGSDRRDLSYEEQEQTLFEAIKIFCNVDGQLGRTILPRPHKPFTDAASYAKWDKISVAERMDQISGKISEEQRLCLLATCGSVCGAPGESVSFMEVLRWWALSGYDAGAFMEYASRWKLKCGQTEFALKMLREAKSSGNLSHRFSTSVDVIDQTGQEVTVISKDGNRFSSQSVVCTIPLNVLNNVTFRPPLMREKVAAASQGHVHRGFKTHAEVIGEGYRSWSATGWPGMVVIQGDGRTPSGNTHLVSFSTNETFNAMEPEHDFPNIQRAFESFKPMHIKRLLYHPWTEDPFAQGTWCMYAPGFATRYQRALQADEGRVIFASADWADGWHGFIDGAIEQGRRASLRASTSSNSP